MSVCRYRPIPAAVCIDRHLPCCSACCCFSLAVCNCRVSLCLVGFLKIKIADPITVRPVLVWGFSFWSVCLLTTPLPLSKHRSAGCPRLPSLTVARSWRSRCLSFAIVDPERGILVVLRSGVRLRSELYSKLSLSVTDWFALARHRSYCHAASSLLLEHPAWEKT